FGLRGHITSLKPLRPENAPDAWEGKALHAFENGVPEVTSVESIGGERHLRFMRPFITEQACLKCHAAQGYRVGDVRGGISVSVPLGPYLAVARADALRVSAGHALFWVLGLVGLCVGASGIRRHVRERDRAEDTLRQSNERLTGLVGELEQRNHQMSLLTEMGDLIQASSSPEQMYAVLAQFVPRLLPAEMGAICVYSPSRNDLEAVAVWGDFPKAAEERVFPPEECWALRRGRPHELRHPKDGLLCSHVKQMPMGGYLCVPLTAQGDTVGLLHLRRFQAAGPAWQTETQTGILRALAEHTALALANMGLRESLRSQSVRDPLTGLFNRRYMEETFEREIRRATRGQRSISLVMLDLDHFKRFNDTFGHDAGDALLRTLGRFLMEHVRGGDIACRYGGEEFTLILPEAPLSVV
ncbi:MAG: diguanylate cyclase, partial [Planctomycetes bacterium]|nr:diguanylate cyclase [Planctomycetota bacterium]